MSDAFERVGILQKLRKKIVVFLHRLLAPAQKDECNNRLAGKQRRSFSAQKEIWQLERTEQKKVQAYMRLHPERVEKIREKHNV